MSYSRKSKGNVPLILGFFVLCIISAVIFAMATQGGKPKPNKPAQVTAQPTEQPTIAKDEPKRTDLELDSIPAIQSFSPKPTETPDLVPYNGRPEHIFFHPIIAYPELTFDDDAQAKGFDDYFVTISEFNKIIQSLYEKDFVLIDINTIFEEVEENGNMVVKKKKPMVPKGKKPLIISIDDLNYYPYMIENGMVHKLIVDKKGQVSTSTTLSDGSESIRRDNEIVPLLDDFVKKHPDFSVNGAKGCIALTGYEGILGYRTQAKSPNRESEIEAVKPVIKKLKDTGWTFASHGWGHLDNTRTSFDKLANDLEKWDDEVRTLIGPTKIYIYPHGARAPRNDPKYPEILKYGFRLLASVGSESYIKYYDNSVEQDRRHIDGIGIRFQHSMFKDLYDSYSVIDPIRPAKYQTKPNK